MKMGTVFDQLYKIIRAAVISAGVLTLIFLIQQKHIFGSEVTYGYDFAGRPKFIQGLYPEGRISQLAEDQQINSEPVYFEVYAPRKYAKAIVKLRYKNPAGLGLKLGLKLAGSEWSFFMAELPISGADFIERSAEFDLGRAERKNNRLKFIFSSPAVNDSPDKIIIDNIEVTLSK